MTLYEKRVNAEGVEEYVAVEERAVKLPDDHPLVKKNRELLEQVKEAKKPAPVIETDEVDDEDTEEVAAPAKPAVRAPAKPKQPAAPTAEEVEAERIRQAELTADIVEKRALARQAESETRSAALNVIIKETGLPESLRPVISAIPDLAQARTQAETLVKAGLRFDETPTGENGERVDLASVLSKADENLQLGDFAPKKQRK